MDKKTVPVTVRIFGKEYPVACPEGEETGLLASAKRVDEEMRRIRDIGKVVGTDRVAIMVSLNLAHELLQLQENMPTEEGDNPVSRQRLQKMQQDIESALEFYQGDLFKASL